MKNYLALQDEGPSDEGSRILRTPVTVIGEWLHAPKSEYAKVQLTVRSSEDFEVVDLVTERVSLRRWALDGLIL